MHGNWNDMNDGSSWGWIPMTIMMLLVWGSLIWFGVALLRRTGAHQHVAATGPAAPMSPNPEQILAERLARGEIEPDDYRTGSRHSQRRALELRSCIRSRDDRPVGACTEVATNGRRVEPPASSQVATVVGVEQIKGPADKAHALDDAARVDAGASGVLDCRTWLRALTTMRR